MEKVYELSEKIDGMDHIKVSNYYSKESGGYEVMISPIKVISNNGIVLYGQPIAGVKIDFKMLIPCNRRSKKKEEETIKIISDNAESFVQDYLNSIGKAEITFKPYD